MEYELINPGTHGCHVVIPELQASKLRADKNKRVICTLDSGFQHHCVLSFKDELGTHIYISKRAQKEAGILDKKMINATIEIDRTKYQARMPQELEEVLNTDPEALEIFEELSMGKKRSILFMVDSAKQSDTRINRALKIVENLKLGVRDPQKFLR